MSTGISKSTTAVALPAFANINFVSAEELQPPPGIATGAPMLDNFLLWKGVPQGEISLFQGPLGTGATSLWVGLTQKVHEQNKWVAWVGGGHHLLPTHLMNRKVNLKRLLVVNKPQEVEQIFWILQELITSSIFEVIGCEVHEMFFKNHQLQKLKKLTRTHKVALVFISHKISRFMNPLFSLIVDFQSDFISVQRAQHRPTPFRIAGSTLRSQMQFLPMITEMIR